MRITNNMMSRSYIGRMNKNLSNLARSNERLSSGIRYKRMSENTSEVSRALMNREQLYRNDEYATTIKHAASELEAVEGNMQIMNNVLRNVEDRLLQASNGTISNEERRLIARELESLKGQVMQISNATFGDKRLFAGSGKDGEAPFSEVGGRLMYNGYPVDDIVINPANGKHAVPDPNNPGALIDLKYNEDIYVDIGLGLSMNGDDLDTKSALKLSTSGLEAFGFGVTDDGMPRNIYSLLDKAVKDIENGDMTEMARDLKRLTGTYDDLLMSITDVGTRASYLEQTQNRMDVENINLKATQQELESIPLEEESIYNKSFEMSWMVTLQLGSKIIPPSIFDFIR